MNNSKDYICKRCNVKFISKSNLKSHLQRKKICKYIEHDINRDSLINELNERKLNDKTYDCEYCNKKFNHTSTKSQHKKICKNKPIDETIQLQSRLQELESKLTNNQKLKLDLEYYKNRKNEKFYQLLLENYLGGTHKTLSCGITDITTDTCHAEIKEWSSWKEAIGQLTCYNVADPKETIEMYMFGRYTQKCKNEAVKIATSCKINVYEFVETDDGISIISLENNEIVYNYKPE
jgi:hypothetical protein